MEQILVSSLEIIKNFLLARQLECFKMTLQGKLAFHSETGTEGGYWAFETDEPILEGQSAFDALYILKDGDRLIVQHPTEKTILWDGVINLIQFDSFTENASGMWIHADQKDISREKWSTYFFNNYPAQLHTKSLFKE